MRFQQQQQRARRLARVLGLRRAEVSDSHYRCIDCGDRVAPVLAELGSLRCHDCRPRWAVVAASR